MQFFRLLEFLLYFYHNGIGSFVPMTLIYGIDSAIHSSDPSYRKFYLMKYIKVAWHYACHSGVRLMHLEL